MNDFIFGTLSTDELRLETFRSLLAGVTHANARTPRDPLPGQAITMELTVGPDHPCEHAWVYWTVDGSDPAGNDGVASTGQSARLDPVAVEWNTRLWGYLRRSRLTIPGQGAGVVLRYRMSAQSGALETFADGNRINACYIADDPIPVWTEQAVVYQIFVDRFYPGNARQWSTPDSLSGFFGGTLGGVRDKLAYLADLGINTLWLTPIFP